MFPMIHVPELSCEHFDAVGDYVWRARVLFELSSVALALLICLSFSTPRSLAAGPRYSSDMIFVKVDAADDHTF